MKPLGRLYLIAIAYSLALLHTVVPHHHPGDGRGGARIVHAGCYLPHGSGLLQKVFSTDLGYGHLQDFNKASDSGLALPARQFLADILPLFVLPSITDDVLSWSVDPYVEKLKRKLLLLRTGVFRAPPF